MYLGIFGTLAKKNFKKEFWRCNRSVCSNRERTRFNCGDLYYFWDSVLTISAGIGSCRLTVITPCTVNSISTCNQQQKLNF